MQLCCVHSGFHAYGVGYAYPLTQQIAQVILQLLILQFLLLVLHLQRAKALLGVLQRLGCHVQLCCQLGYLRLLLALRQSRLRNMRRYANSYWAMP